MVSTARPVVCLLLWLLACQGRGSYVSERMHRTLKNLLQHYKIPPYKRFDGKPVFSREILSGKLEVKQVFMSGVLEVYEKLIGQMLRELPDPSPQPQEVGDASAANTSASESGTDGDVRAELSYILKKVQELRKYRFHEEEKLLEELHHLKHIQLDNLVVQSKALWELPWLYEVGSALHETRMNRRRMRREERRGSKHT